MKGIPGSLLICLVLVFYSCKKEKGNKLHADSVTGIVLHAISKHPLPGETVKLFTAFRWTGPADSEFPNGVPMVRIDTYTTVTDNQGRFRFDFNIESQWTFSVIVVPGTYIQSSSVYVSYPLDPNRTNLEQNRTYYDTILCERPGYIRYLVNNISPAYSDDTLLVQSISNKWIRPDFTAPFYMPPDYTIYNWIFVGQNVQSTIIDTLPGETVPKYAITWLYKRIGTVINRTDSIPIQANSTTDYHLDY
jgi:hypothetical protein